MFDSRQIRLAMVCFASLLATPCSAAQRVLESNVEQAFQLAAGHYQRGEWDESVAAFEEIAARYTDSREADDAYFFLGEALIQLQEFKKAYLALHNYQLRHPNGEFSSRAAFRMGEASMRMNQTTRAIRLLEGFVDQHPNDSLMQFALAYLGEMRLARKEPQLAQRVFEAALRIQPGGQIANQCRFGLAKSLQMQGNIDDALNFYDFIVREPNNPLADDARLQAAILHFGVAQYEEALELLSPIVDSLDSVASAETVSKAYYWLGRIALSNDRFKDAVRNLRQMDTSVVESDIAVAAWYDGAIAATKAGDHAQSEQWLTQIVEEHPTHSLADDAMFLQVRNAFLREEYTTVATLASEFLREHLKSPFCNQVNKFLGQVAYQNEDYDQTVTIFSKLLHARKNSNNSNQQQRLTWSYYLALGHIGRNEFEQAETILQALASSDELEVQDAPQSLSTLVQIALATVRFSQNKFESSVENYEKYLSIVGHNPETQQSQVELTIAYARTGLWEQARQSYEQWRSHDREAKSVGETLPLLVSIAREASDDAETEYWLNEMSSTGVPDDIGAIGLSELAWMKLEHGDILAANKLLDQLLAEFPLHSIAAKAGIVRAKNMEAAGQFGDAAEIYAAVIENFSNQPIAHVAQLRRAYALQNMGSRESLRLAKKTIDDWIAAASEGKEATNENLLAEAIYQSGWICEDLGEPITRDQRFRQLVNGFPDSKYWPDAAYRVAKQHVVSRDFPQASMLIETIQHAEQCPQRILDCSTFLMGQIKSKQHRWAEAEEVFERIVSSTDNENLKVKSRYWLAESVYRQDKFSTANKYFSMLDDCKASELRSLRPWILLRLAQTHAKLKQWQAAAEVSQKALIEFERFSLKHEFVFFVARGLEDAGQLNEAIISYQKVIDSRSVGATETAAIAQWRIGEIHFHQEQYAAAVRAYYRVDSIFGYPRWRSAALLQAAKCQEYLENWKHAEKLYRQLLALFPDSELAGEARDRLTRLRKVAATVAPSHKNKQR